MALRLLLDHLLEVGRARVDHDLLDLRLVLQGGHGASAQHRQLSARVALDQLVGDCPTDFAASPE
jgi:hypothetical protein